MEPVLFLYPFIEAALDKRIRKEYRLQPAQLGFQRGKGTEKAILRSKASMRKGALRIAVLDLKAAYDSVPRGALMHLVRKALSPDLANMVHLFLAPGKVAAVGDAHPQWYTVDRGVPQGSPLSPCVFNIFMDSLASAVEEAFPKVSSPPITLFADDVKFGTKNVEDLQKFLDIATAWADRFSMTWNTNKSWILRNGLTREAAFRLAGHRLELADEVEYLGVTLHGAGVSNRKNVHRVRTAHTVLADLRKQGLFKWGIHPVRCISIHKSLIQSRW